MNRIDALAVAGILALLLLLVFEAAAPADSVGEAPGESWGAVPLQTRVSSDILGSCSVCTQSIKGSLPELVILAGETVCVNTRDMRSVQ